MATSIGTIRTSAVEIGGATSYLARPRRTAKAGLVLVPTVAGLDRAAREYADRFAEHGIATLAWNQYAGTAEAPPSEEARARSAKLTDPECLAQLSTCVDTLHGEVAAAPVGAIGFCFGGRMVLLMAAADPRVQACVAVYPSVRDEAPVARAAEIRCPVQLIYPGQDHVTARSIFDALSTALYARTAPTTVLVYPEAGHGFMHRPNPANDAATRAAWPQIDGFLTAHLGA